MLINFQGLKKSSVLTLFFILTLTSSIVSCKCNEQQNKGNGSARLVMEVNRLQLDPANMTITATFHLTEPGKKADLANYQLKVKLDKQEGGNGSYLTYQAYQGATGHSKEVEEITGQQLTHFTPLTSLEDGGSPLQIDFKVTRGNGVSLLVYQVEAFDSAGTSIGNYPVTYELDKKLPGLTLVSKEELEGSQKEIKLNLNNPTSDPIAPGTLKLQITRTAGTQATIVGANPIAIPNTYEVIISEEIGTKQTLPKTLIIDSDTDIKAAFSIRLVREEIKGNPITVKWEKGIQLELVAKCEGNSRELSYTVTNTGSKGVNNLRLQYTCKTPGIQLGTVSLNKDQINEISIGNIKEKGKIENQILGKLGFGTNLDADFVFKLVYDGANTQEEPFTFTALDVQLNIENLTHDLASGKVSYVIHNKGQDPADEVQVRYANQSTDEAGKKVVLNNQITATTVKVNIPKTSLSSLTTLPIDFGQADEAIFKFEVLYKGKVINQATRTEPFKAKDVKLKLVPVGGPTNNILLTGANQTFKCKIELEADSRPIKGIDPKHVSVAIENKLGNSSFITKAAGGTEKIDHLTGADLGNIGDELILYINPNGEKIADFELVLSYKHKPPYAPLSISWKNDEIEIKDLNPFVGTNEASFTLFNSVAAIDPGQLIIEITSDNAANFALIKQDGSQSVNTATLDQLIGAATTPVNVKTAPIRFKLANPNGQDKSQVTVYVKRGTEELTRQTITWKAKGLSIQNDEVPFKDQDPFKLILKNTGDVVDTDKIKVKFINDKNVAFKIGNLSANATTDFSLSEIIDDLQLVKDKPIEIIIQQDAAVIPDLYGTHIILELLDEAGTTLEKKDLVWGNITKMGADLIPLDNALEAAGKEFNEYDQQAKAAPSWGDRVEVVKKMVQLKATLEQLLDKINKIDVNKVFEELKDIIEEELIKVSERRIEGLEQNIIDYTQEFKNEIDKSVDNAEIIIQYLASATEVKVIDDNIVWLNKELYNMDYFFRVLEDIVSVCNIKEVEDMKEKAREMIASIEDKAESANEEAEKMEKGDTAYQIQNAATIEEGIKIAKNLYDAAPLDVINGKIEAYKKALHTYRLVIEKAYKSPDEFPITLEQIRSIDQANRTIMGMINITEIGDEASMILGYAVLLTGKEIRADISSNKLSDARIKWNSNIIKQNTLGWIATLKPSSEEAKQIFEEAKQEGEDVEKLLKI
jgi:hypothetical protein